MLQITHLRNITYVKMNMLLINNYPTLWSIWLWSNNCYTICVFIKNITVHLNYKSYQLLHLSHAEFYNIIF